MNEWPIVSFTADFLSQDDSPLKLFSNQVFYSGQFQNAIFGLLSTTAEPLL
jgi:hypothetical protein